MATTGFLKVSWLLLYCVMSSTRINNYCQQNGLLRFKEIIDSNRIGGHRLADMNMIVFEKDVFTNLQCLDLCLRIKVCASIDIKKQNTQRSCRVNRANPKYFIIENDDWTHINLSSRALEEVSSGPICAILFTSFVREMLHSIRILQLQHVFTSKDIFWFLMLTNARNSKTTKENHIPKQNWGSF